MSRACILAWTCLLTVSLVAGPAPAGLPDRPAPDRGSNFYLLAGIGQLAFDLDPRGAQDFVDAGLDPRLDDSGVLVGVGWVFRRPLRLELVAGGWRATIDREGVDCLVGGALADLHVAIAESKLASLEGSFSVGTISVVYEGLPNEEVLIGTNVGVGLTGRLSLFGSLGASAGYQWLLGRYQPTTFEMPDDTTIRVQPTAQMHLVRVLVYLDI